MLIEVGSKGKLIESLARGGGQDWKLHIEYEYIGHVDACGTNLHIFKSVVGGYETTVAERDFTTGMMQFTGSPFTQREPFRPSKAKKSSPDYSVTVGLPSFKAQPPTGVSRL